MSVPDGAVLVENGSVGGGAAGDLGKNNPLSLEEEVRLSLSVDLFLHSES